jgi:hypothetical protein
MDKTPFCEDCGREIQVISVNWEEEHPDIVAWENPNGFICRKCKPIYWEFEVDPVYHYDKVDKPQICMTCGCPIENLRVPLEYRKTFLLNQREQFSKNQFDNYSNYVGTCIEDNWRIVISQTRDSDSLERSNFRIALKELGGESKFVEIHRFGHWGCGWYEILFVDDRNTDKLKIAEEIVFALENYPVLDEEDFSELENEEAQEVWKSCYKNYDRLEYVRKHRSQFEFSSFEELLECVRGKFFSGYSSDLLR